MAQKGPTQEEMAKEIESLWDHLSQFLDEKVRDSFLQAHPITDEIYQYGSRGPVGLGLGNYGGHVV